MKAKHLYGDGEDFQCLRDAGAINIYVKHRLMLQERKDELEARGVRTHNDQVIWEKLDKAIRHWLEIQGMVYGSNSRG